MQFPSTQKTVGFPVTHATTESDIDHMKALIARMCADRVVILSIEPFDVKAAPLWASLEETFSGVTRYFEVHQVTPEEFTTLARRSTQAYISLILPSMDGRYQSLSDLVGAGDDVRRFRAD